MGKVKEHSGKWQVQNTYGPNYNERLRGMSAPFALDIAVDRKGQFVGACLEPEGPGVGVITGRVFRVTGKFSIP